MPPARWAARSSSRVLVWSRRPVYAGVFMVVVVRSSRTAPRSARGPGSPSVPGLGLSQGNLPSGVASGYVVFDVVALALVARLGLAAAALQSRRVRRSVASTTVPEHGSARARSRPCPRRPRAGTRAPCRRRRRRQRRPCGSARPTRRPCRGANRRHRRPRSRARRGPSRRTADGRTASPHRPCSRRRRARACSHGPRARRVAFLREQRLGSEPTSPAANTSSRPPALPNSSTRMPSSTSRPAASASSVAGTIPSPATIASASIVVPFFVVTEPEATCSDDARP